MNETLYLLKKQDYEQLSPIIREYEDNLTNLYKSDDSVFVNSENVEKIFNQIASFVREKGEVGLNITTEMMLDIRGVLQEIKRNQPSNYQLINSIYQSIGINATEAKVFVERLSSWHKIHNDPIYKLYLQAANCGFAIVSIPEK